MSPTASNLQAPPVAVPAQIGRYSVEPHVDPEHYTTWYVKVTAMIPGTGPVVEAIGIDRARACRIAGALAAADAIRKLLPQLNELVERGGTPEMDAEMQALAAALRFMREP
jgi:hypothetical protein